MKVIKRSLEKDVLNSSIYFPVVAILGPRQSGKTTLAQMIFKNHTYLSLEDIDIRTAALEDPRSFIIANMNEHGLIIDEFQYAPKLLSYIQTIVDKEQKPGYFILTGSQNFLMNQAITQSLAGRVSIHILLPLCVSELEKNNLLPEEIEKALYQGFYPAIYSKNVPPDLLYKNYITTYVERDIRQLANIGDLTTFKTFMTLCASRVGQILNLTSIGNECGISDSTVKRWLSILEASYIVYLLYPHYKNFGKRLIKSPKVYFYDTGLACNLLQIKEKELATHPNKGGLFESFVISEILKLKYNNGQTPNIYFWRDKTGNEVDCIIEKGENLTPIEIKSSRTINQRFFEGLSYWNEISGYSPEHGFVIFAGSKNQTRTRSNLISWQSIDEVLEK